MTPESRLASRQEDEALGYVAGDIFDWTMQGLEAGLHVAHITTFELKTCGPDDETSGVMSDPGLMGFDQIPVIQDGHILGVLHRQGGNHAGKVSERMSRLNGSLLIAAQAPLMAYVRLAPAGPYRLVVTEKGISGIVTRSDLLKLPVRLLAFAFVTHLEMLMADVIRDRCGVDGNAWLEYLTDGRKQKIAEKQRSLGRDSLDPALLELADFCDKRVVVAKLLALGKEFTEHLEEIEKLRNSLAHAATFLNNDAEVSAFVERMRIAERWIDELRNHGNEPGGKS